MELTIFAPKVSPVVGSFFWGSAMKLKLIDRNRFGGPMWHTLQGGWNHETKRYEIVWDLTTRIPVWWWLWEEHEA
jgi:hypothetical protein